MYHADIMPIATCFTYTLYHFYAFSGTNLLTRCHSASSCFLLFLVSEKLFWKYSRNWTKRKPKVLFFCHVHGVRRRLEGGRGGSHTMWRRARGGTRAATWCGGLVALLRLFFGLRGCIGENRSVAFHFVQFREYFLNNFSKTKNSRK